MEGGGRPLGLHLLCRLSLHYKGLVQSHGRVHRLSLYRDYRFGEPTVQLSNASQTPPEMQWLKTTLFCPQAGHVGWAQWVSAPLRVSWGGVKARGLHAGWGPGALVPVRNRQQRGSLSTCASLGFLIAWQLG